MSKKKPKKEAAKQESQSPAKKAKPQPQKKAEKKAQKKAARGPMEGMIAPEFSFPFDPEMMKSLADEFLAQLEMTGSDEERDALTKDKKAPLTKAQKLVYKAEEEFDPVAQIALCEKAIKTSPDCVDAYVMLAELADTDEQALELYREAVAAGTRFLGEEFLAKEAGQFWRKLTTRPYMRARFGLGNLLWALGHTEESLTHLRELLRLNPEDDQGSRYALSSYLLQLGRDQELADLIEQYSDDQSAEWLYQTAILAFRSEGDTPQTRLLLHQAGRENPHVAAYMVDFKPLPPTPPPFCQPGEEDEAIHYTIANRAGWKTTAGAIPWIRKVLNPELPPEELEEAERAAPRKKIDWKELKALAATDEVWQVDQVLSPIIDEETAESVDFWVWVVVKKNEAELLDNDFIDEAYTPADALNRLYELMTNPPKEYPAKPARIETRIPAFAKAWTSKLQKLDVECELVEAMEPCDNIVEQMNAMFEQNEGRNVAIPTDEDLLEIPLELNTVWQLDCRQLPTWIHEDGDAQRPWMFIIANCEDGTIMGQHVSPEVITGVVAWQVTSRALSRPMVGEPHRPGRIEMSSPELRGLLMPHLEKLNISCVVRDNLDDIDRLFHEVGRHLSGQSSVPAITESPGMSIEQVGEYFDAAAEFFRRAPWRQIRGDLALRLEVPKYESKIWYAVVMGQSGITIGLALYSDRKMLDRLLQGEAADEPEHVRKMSGLSMMYGEAFEMSPIDVEACERYGWSLATTEAYPHAMWLDPGINIRAPLAWELELLTGALRAIPNFLASKPKDAQTIQVPAVDGQLEITVSYLDR